MEQIEKLLIEEFKNNNVNFNNNLRYDYVDDSFTDVLKSVIGVVKKLNYTRCCVNKDLDKHPIEGVNETMQVDDDISNLPLVICKKCGSSEMYQYTKLLDKCEDCGHTQNY